MLVFDFVVIFFVNQQLLIANTSSRWIKIQNHFISTSCVVMGLGVHLNGSYMNNQPFNNNIYIF